MAAAWAIGGAVVATISSIFGAKSKNSRAKKQAKAQNKISKKVSTNTSMVM